MKNGGSIADQNYYCLNLSDWNIWFVSDKSNDFYQSLFNSSPICVSMVLYACVHQSSCCSWATLFFFAKYYLYHSEVNLWPFEDKTSAHYHFVRFHLCVIWCLIWTVRAEAHFSHWIKASGRMGQKRGRQTVQLFRFYSVGWDVKLS